MRVYIYTTMYIVKWMGTSGIQRIVQSCIIESNLDKCFLIGIYLAISYLVYTQIFLHSEFWKLFPFFPDYNLGVENISQLKN